MAGRRLDVMVSGGGIAGATLACLLSRSGHRVTVVERDRGVRSSGNPVDVRGPAFDVVEGLDLVPRLRDLATSVRRVVFVDEAGRAVARMATRRSREREMEVHRADLSAVLIDAARNDVDFRFDDVLVDVHADENGVDVTFDRAAPSRFDLVVGADGLHSGVRRLAFGPESVYVTHLGMYVATVPLDECMDRVDTVLMHNRPGAAVALHPGAGRPGAAFLFRSSERADPRDTEDVTRLMTAVYGDSGWRTPELLAAYLAAGDTYFDMVSRVSTPTWSTGRITLVGDAATCVTLFGEGSSSAILGAATLAGALASSPQDIPAALARYEKEHRPVTRRWQRAVPIASHLLIPATRAGITLRNCALHLARSR
jgi:2-polyprenyl-6-methoxyphenol hydroxylase-like FAD-dependent oxidoreductase